jgi:hypothetical protein
MTGPLLAAPAKPPRPSPSPDGARKGEGKAEDAKKGEEDERRAAAKRFFDTGMLLYDRGEFLEAAVDFERAYREAQLPAFLYNIATA